LSIFFAYSLVLATSRQTYTNRFLFLNFLILISTLMLVKDMSIFFVIVIAAVVGANSFMFAKLIEMPRRRKILVSITRAALTFITGYLTRFIWLNFANGGNLSETSSATLAGSGSRLRKTFNSDGVFTNEVTVNFLNKIFDEPLQRWVAFSPEWIGFPLSTIQWIFIFSLLMILIIVNSQSKISKIQEIFNAVLILGGAFCYFLVLLISYLNIFKGINSIILTSVDRYIATYLSGVVFYLSARAVQQIYKSNVEVSEIKDSNIKLPSLSIGLIFVFLFQAQVSYLTNYYQKPNEYSDNLRVNYKTLTEKIKFLNLTADDRVWIISQDTMGFEFYIFQYEVLPASVGSIPFSIGTPSSPQDIWTDPKMTPEKWDEALDNYDYVLIFKTTDSFVSEFGPMFEDPSSLIEQGIYRVEKDQTGNRLVKHI